MQNTQTIDQTTTVNAEYKENTKIKMQFFNTKHGSLRDTYYAVNGRILDLSPELKGKKVKLTLFMSSADKVGLSVEVSLIKGSDIRFGKGRLYDNYMITLRVDMDDVFHKNFPIAYSSDTVLTNTIEIPA